MDSNSRSTSWHDILTNSRGRILEGFVMSKQLHIMNEESHLTTFRSSRGSSNSDLTAINNQLLSTVMERQISDQESFSDHSIISYVIGHSTARRAKRVTGEVKYKVTKEDEVKFQSNLIRLAELKLCDPHNAGGIETLDKILCTRATKELDIEKLVEEFYEVLEEAHSKPHGLHRRQRRIKLSPGGRTN
jgi:hypothetical protein